MQRLWRAARRRWRVISDVRKFGWHCVYILPEEQHAGFAYSIGLFKSYGFSELLIYGLSHDVSHQILTIAASAAQRGCPIDLTQPSSDLIEDFHCHFVPVAESEYFGHVGQALGYYGRESFPLHQIVWPSSDGWFPWEAQAADQYKDQQPVLARRRGDA